MGSIGKCCLIGAVVLTVALAPLRGQQRDEPPSALSGVVVDAVTGAPVPWATVRASGLDDDPGTRPARRQADEQGRFVFPEIASGRTYRIGAEKSGYLPTQDGPPAARGTVIALGRSEWVRDVRVPLWPPAVIAGTVLDEMRDPVVGAVVQAYSRVPGTRRFALGPSVTTDDEGQYRIYGLPGGTYIVGVQFVIESAPASMSQATLNGLPADAASRTRGGAPVPGVPVDSRNRMLARPHPIVSISRTEAARVWRSQYFSGAYSAEGASPIALESGEVRTGVDFYLDRTSGWSVSGVVLGDPRQITGLTVRLTAPGNEVLGRGGESASTITDSAGRFSFPIVPNGPYVLSALPGEAELVTAAVTSMAGQLSLLSRGGRAGGRVSDLPGRSGGLSLLRRGAGVDWGRQTVEVRDTHVGDVALRLHAGTVISGRLMLEPGDSPPAHRTAALEIQPDLMNELLVMPAVSVDGTSDGSTPWAVTRHFEVRGLTPGSYHFRSGAQDAAIRSVLWRGQEYVDRPFEVAEQSASDVTITVTTRLVRLTGLVRDRSLAPVPAACVLAFKVDSASDTVIAESIRYEWTDNLGRFTFPRLSAGQHFMVAARAVDADISAGPDTAASLMPFAVRVQAEWGDVKDVTLSLQSGEGR